MIELLCVLLAAVPTQADEAAVTNDPIGPLVVVELRDGPMVVVREQPAPPLVAIRLSIPVEEPAGLEGATIVLQEASRQRLEAGAAELGGKAMLARTASHAVYGVVGPAASFDDLVELLRDVVDPFAADPSDLEAARRVLRWEATAALEIPDRLIRRRLHAALFPMLPAATGDPAAAATLNLESLRAFWARSYRPGRMRAVVAGPVSAAAVRAAFRDWPDPAGRDGPDPVERRRRSGRSRPTPPRVDDAAPAPEVIFPWVGIGYAADDADPTALAVAAALIDGRLAALGLRSASAELWWGAGRMGLVVIGSGGTTDGAVAAPELRARLSGVVADLADGVSPAAVTGAARSLRLGILFGARTPDGMAALIGELADRTGDAEAIVRFLAGLERIDAARVRSTLRRLVERGPVAVEVGP